VKRKHTKKPGKYSRDNMAARMPSVQNLASMAAAARLHEDETVKNMIRAVQYTDDPEIAEIAWDYLGAMATEEILNHDPFALKISPEEAEGEINLGLIRNPAILFGLRLDEINKPVLVTGALGGGKTTFIRRIIKQLIPLVRSKNKKINVHIFDIKRDYLVLNTLFPEFIIFTLPDEHFRWNPLEPPIKNWRQWAGILAAVFSNSWGLFGGMSTENDLYKYLFALYEKYDPENGIYPCLFDLLDYLLHLKFYKKIDRYSEEYKSFTRILNRVESLCRSLGETVNCSQGYPISVLQDLNIVFDLTGLKTDAQTFFTELFLTQALWYRMESGERGGILRTLSVFDEGKRLMPQYREKAQNSICNMSHNLAMGREFGLSFVIGECDPDLLARSAKSACYTRVCFRQSHGLDVRESASDLGLDREQAAEIQRLRTGEAIVRMGGRIDGPFVLEVAQ
jgi:DNA helicase HerA-like ATPase